MAKPHKPHKRVYDHTLKPGIQNPFSPGRHNALWLSQILVSFSQRRGNDNLGRLQKLALNHFHTNPVFNITNEATNIRKETVIAAYFNLFDELFFFGTLGVHCDVFLDDELCHAGRGGTVEFVDLNPKGFLGKIFGGKSKPSPVLESNVKSILIVLYKHVALSSRYDGLCLYLGTLLHQMLHVFYSLWSCDSEHCSHAFDVLGKGHWVAWQNAAVAIEKAVRDESFLNLDLRIGREKGLLVELDKTGLMMNSLSDEIVEWGMDRKEVERLAGKGRRDWCVFDIK